MKFELWKIGSEGTVYLLDDYVDRDKTFSFMSEYERDAFDVVYGDITFTLDNSSEYFTNIFSGSSNQSRWIIKISEGIETLYSGYIEKTNFTPNDEYVILESFSTTKMFWERCKKMYIRNNPKADLKYQTFEKFLQFNLLPSQYGGLINPVDPFTDLFTRLTVNTAGWMLDGNDIRWWQHDTVYGDYGRYFDLDNKTTVYDLLIATEMQYNCQFILDYPSKTLTVQKRRTVLSSSAKSIDGYVCEDKTIDFNPIGKQKYEYIYTTFLGFELPKLIQIAVVSSSTNDIQTYPNLGSKFSNITIGDNSTEDRIYYLLVAFSNDTPYGLSTFSTLVGQIEEHGGKWYGFNVHFNIPVCPSGTTKRKLYRKVGTAYYQVGEWNDNYLILNFIDNAGINTSEIHDSRSLKPFLGWLRYDEVNGRWDSMIPDIDGGNNRPLSDKIFEMLPKLTFVDPVSGQNKNDSIYDAMCFFGRRITPGLMKETFLDLFKTTPELKCTVSRTDIKAGDEIIRPNLPNLGSMMPASNFIVLKASFDVSNEETTLEMEKL